MTFVDFCERVLKVDLTLGQRTIAKIAFDRVEPEALSGEERALAYTIFGPVETFPPAARSVLVAVLGARSGKSYVFIALYSLWRAVFADLSTLAPGEVGVALIVAPDVETGKVSIRYALGAIQSEPYLNRMLIQENERSLLIQRPDGRKASIEVFAPSGKGSRLRGRSLLCGCLDEAAFFYSEDHVVNPEDLFSAIFPRILPGGLAIVASTPWIEEGLLYELFSRNFGAPRDAMAAHGPTLVMNRSQRNIESYEREVDPDKKEREWEARFILSGSSKFFPPELLESVFVDDVERTLVPTPFHRSHIGGDIGLVSDASSIVAVHAKSASSFFVADLIELRPKKGAPLKLSNVVGLGCEFAHRHGDNVLWLDNFALEPAREHLPKGFSLLAVPAGNAQKTARWLAARQAMKEGKLRIPAEFVRLKIQLAEVCSKPMPGGGLQILQKRSRGQNHGDVAAAAVNSIEAALRFGGPRIHVHHEKKRREYESAREMKY